MTTTIISSTAGSNVESFINRIVGSTSAVFTDNAAIVTNSSGERITMRGNFGDVENINLAMVTSFVLSDNGSAYATSSGFSISYYDFIMHFFPFEEKADGLFDSLGSHTMLGNAGIDVFNGTESGDILRGAAGNDTIFGDAGDDLIEGGIGADILKGGTGNDTATYLNSSTRVTVDLRTGKGTGGEAAGDTLYTIENLTGSDFNDSLNGNRFANTLEGGKGNDTLAGFEGADRHDGGEGTDTVLLTTSTAGVVVNLETGRGSGGIAAGDTYANIENVTASAYNDVLIGDARANVFLGNGGNDRLDGGLNNDTLRGGAGNDRLIGGQGQDKLFGDLGIDTMVLDRFPGNSDTIYGFVAGTDRLEINAADFAGGLTAGQALDPGQLLLNGTGLAGDADDRFILNTTTGELFYDVNGSVGGATGSQLIAVFAGGIPTLTSSDFVIV